MADFSQVSAVLSKRVDLLAAPGSAVSLGAAADDRLPIELVDSTIASAFNSLLAREQPNRALFANLLDQLNAAKPLTRSQSKQQRNSKGKQTQNEADAVLAPTPLSELVVHEGHDEMTWRQLLLKLEKSQKLLKKVLGQSDYSEATAVPEDSLLQALPNGDTSEDLLDDEEDDDDFESEVDSEEDGESDAEIVDDYEEAEESYVPLNKSSNLASPDGKRNGKRSNDEVTLATFDDDVEPSSKKRKTGSNGPITQVDDEFFSLTDFLADSERGEREMARLIAKADKGGQDDLDDDGLEDVDLFVPVDGNNAEQDSSDDEAIDLGGDEDDDITYETFFAPPRQLPAKKAKSSPKKSAPKPNTANNTENGDLSTLSKRSVRFAETVRVKPIAPRKQRPLARLLLGLDDAAELANEEDEGLETEESLADLGSDQEGESGEEDFEEDPELNDIVDDLEEPDENADQAITRFRSDLFDQDSDTSDEEGKQGLSRHERRQKELAKQIAQLEQENVQRKDWTLMGEARGKERPINSLLEEDLDFESSAKSAPAITTEATLTLEEKIKQRILNDDWDDVVRKLPFDPKAFLPSRLLDIDATQSGKSLAELYEDEYSRDRLRAEGKNIPADERDVALGKNHKEIENLFESISNKLDALSNARFTPKAPETRIESQSNMPTITMESALPATVSSGSLLAPEEVYKATHKTSMTTQDKSDLTPAQKRAARGKDRHQKAKDFKRVNTLSGVNGIKTVATKQAKERAREKLIGKKGVTVIGKGESRGKSSGSKKGRSRQK